MPSRYGPGVLPNYPVAERTGFERAVGAIGGAVRTYNDIRDRREQKKIDEEERAIRRAIAEEQYGIEINPEETHPVFGGGSRRGAGFVEGEWDWMTGGGGEEPPPRPGVGRGMGVRPEGFEYAAPAPPSSQFREQFRPEERKAFLSPEDRGLEPIYAAGDTRIYRRPYEETREGRAESRATAKREAEITQLEGAIGGIPELQGVSPEARGALARYGDPGDFAGLITNAIKAGDTNRAQELAHRGLQKHFPEYYGDMPFTKGYDYISEYGQLVGKELTHRQGLENIQYRESLKSPAAEEGVLTLNQALTQVDYMTANTKPPPSPSEKLRMARGLMAGEEDPFAPNFGNVRGGGASSAGGSYARGVEGLDSNAVLAARGALEAANVPPEEWEAELRAVGATDEMIAAVVGG